MKKLLLVCSLAWACLLSTAAQAFEITAFVAASLTNAMEEIGKNYSAKSGDTVRYAFAASSVLAKQIEAGAGAQVFISADEAWMDYLEQRKLVEPGSRNAPLSNRLVLVVPKDKTRSMTVVKGGDWLAKLGEGRIATGDPAHVPVGRYAQESLTFLGAWAQVEPRLARADNVRAALALVERGEAAAGIVYATDAAVSKGVAVAATFPPDSHKSISYPFAIVAGQASPPVRAFMAYLRSPDAVAVYRKYGFAVKP
ncbi:MAG: molybdate ABC transporter substrate-binding protein [Burkholderiaceae bacterium]